MSTCHPYTLAVPRGSPWPVSLCFVGFSSQHCHPRLLRRPSGGRREPGSCLGGFEARCARTTTSASYVSWACYAGSVETGPQKPQRAAASSPGDSFPDPAASLTFACTREIAVSKDGLRCRVAYKSTQIDPQGTWFWSCCALFA